MSNGKKIIVFLGIVVAIYIGVTILTSVLEAYTAAAMEEAFRII